MWSAGGSPAEAWIQRSPKALPSHCADGRVLADVVVDVADALIAETARQAGCEHTVTFDRRAAKSAGMRLLT